MGYSCSTKLTQDRAGQGSQHNLNYNLLLFPNSFPFLIFYFKHELLFSILCNLNLSHRQLTSTYKGPVHWFVLTYTMANTRPGTVLMADDAGFEE
jgi:hypothetical protein